MKEFIQGIVYPTKFETLLAKERAESNRGKNLSRLGKRSTIESGQRPARTITTYFQFSYESLIPGELSLRERDSNT
jgi:hypothetical protein